MTMLAGTYDFRLVVLSMAIAILASYAALDLAGRVTANHGRTRTEWLAGGALAMGTGIWAMHYTGMLAFRLPVEVYYHIPTVALSWLASVLASLIALYVAGCERLTALRVGCGSLLMGIAIATMHYMGMAAMRMSALHHYSNGKVGISILLAIMISFVGLRLLFYSRDESQSAKLKIWMAIVFGSAICVMHYTGMAAVTFTSTSTPPNMSWSVDISALANAALLVVVVVILAFVMVASLMDRRLLAQRLVLNDERNRLRALLDNIPDFMYVKDRQGRFVIANAHLARVLGKNSADDLLGKTDFDFFPRELATAYYADEQHVIRTGQPLFDREEKGVDREGNTTYILTTKVPLRTANGSISGIAGIGRDISMRKSREDALREAERKYRGIFDDAIVGIFQISPAGRFLSVNQSMARIFGFVSPEEMIASVTDIPRQLFVERKRYEEFVQMMNSLGSMLSLECEAYRKDGARIWVACSGRAVNKDRVLVRYEGMTEDITESKMLHSQLLQAQKLESIGQLAAGIAHEINTPTQYIGDNVRFLKVAFAELNCLLKAYQETLSGAEDGRVSAESLRRISAIAGRADAAYFAEEIPKAIDQTLEGVSRVSTLVSAMKEFSHPGAKEKIPLDLNHAIASTITVARNEWKYLADLTTDFDPSLPPVSCQAGEFNQVILNLIVNAAHAIADVVAKGGVSKGTIRVQTRNLPEWAEIRIQDSGTGIPEKVQTRIFDPFFTTKEIGKGTGQGLAIARSVVVDKHKGTIHFETEEDKGTTFVIRLPKDGKALNAGMGSA